MKEIEIRIHSQNGDDRRICGVADAVSILTEQVKKYGKWVYVGTNRFRLDPDSDESVGTLQETLSEETTRVVHVTGSLRGGSPELRYDDLVKKTLPELRSIGTKMGLKSISRTSKGYLIDMILDTSKSTKSTKSTKTAPKAASTSKTNPISLIVSEVDPYALANSSDKLLIAVVSNPGEVQVGFSKKDLAKLKNEVASLILEILK